MWLDAHQHFWRYDPDEYGWIDGRMSVLKRDFTAEDLSPHLEEHSISGAVAVQARHSLSETEDLLAIADRHDFVRGVVGWVDLCSEDAPAQLERFSANPHFVGVRHIAQDEADDRFLVREDFLRGIALLEPMGLCYDILVYPRQLPAAIELVAKFPAHRFVLDHIAKPPIGSGRTNGWDTELLRLARYENVFCKVSGMVTEAKWDAWKPSDFEPYLDVVFEAFGVERLLFGSDWPVCTLASTYNQVVEVVTDYLGRGSERTREAVMGQNAIAFYRLDEKRN